MPKPTTVNFELITSPTSVFSFNSSSTEPFGYVEKIGRYIGSGVFIKNIVIKKGGTIDERKIYTFSGTVHKNRPTKLARIVFNSYPEGKPNQLGNTYFKKPPFLSFDKKKLGEVSLGNNNLKLIPLGDFTSSTNKNRYTFDLVYTHNESFHTKVPERAYINLDIMTVHTRGSEALSYTTNYVEKLSYGTSIVNQGGEKRIFTIYGKPGSFYDIAIDKVVESIDSSGETVSFIKQTILPNPTITQSVENRKITETPKIRELSLLSDELGVPKRTMVGLMPDTGKVNFYVNFPSVNVLATNVNGAISGAAKVIFDDLTGVNVGDTMYSAGVRVGKVSVLNPDDDNVNECTMDDNISIADNAGVEFKREAKYHVDMFVKGGAVEGYSPYKTGLGPSVPKTSPTYVLNQYINPVLTLKAKVGSNYALTHVNGVATSLSAGQDYSNSYVGRPNKRSVKLQNISSVTKSTTVTYTINGDGSKSFTANRVPYFSQSLAHTGLNTPSSTGITTSDWTNTLIRDSYGTDINITNIKSVLSADGGTADGICTISFDVDIEKWGTKDVTMELDLDDLLTTT
jgi:hypothetical protein